MSAATRLPRSCCQLTCPPPSCGRSYEYCQLPPPGSAIGSKLNGADGTHDGVHNGAGMSDGQTPSQLQEVALTGLEDKPQN